MKLRTIWKTKLHSRYESIVCIKTIITALKEESKVLHVKVETLAKKLVDNEMYFKSLNQYNRRNNLETHNIYS